MPIHPVEQGKLFVRGCFLKTCFFPHSYTGLPLGGTTQDEPVGQGKGLWRSLFSNQWHWEESRPKCANKSKPKEKQFHSIVVQIPRRQAQTNAGIPSKIIHSLLPAEYYCSLKKRVRPAFLSKKKKALTVFPVDAEILSQNTLNTYNPNLLWQWKMPGNDQKYIFGKETLVQKCVPFQLSVREKLANFSKPAHISWKLSLLLHAFQSEPLKSFCPWLAVIGSARS